MKGPVGMARRHMRPDSTCCIGGGGLRWDAWWSTAGHLAVHSAGIRGDREGGVRWPAQGGVRSWSVCVWRLVVTAPREAGVRLFKRFGRLVFWLVVGVWRLVVTGPRGAGGRMYMLLGGG